MSRIDRSIWRREGVATDAAKIIAGVLVVVILAVALFRYAIGWALEVAGPFAMLAVLAVGIVALAYISVWEFRLIRRTLSSARPSKEIVP